MVTLASLGLDPTFRRPSRPARIGIVGLGGISSVHFEAYREAGWSVVHGADISPERRAWAQAEHGLTHATDDWRRVVEDPAVEVVSLLTQPTFREEVVAACADLGKPILVEKPLAGDLATARRMADLAEAKSLATTVSQNYRWLSGPFVARQLVQQGRIGEVFFVSLEIFGTQDRDIPADHFYGQCRDFLTVQWNTHLADLIRCFAGRDGHRLFARTRRAPGQNFVSDNLFLSWVELGEGVTGHILHHELVRTGMTGERFRIDGSQGTLEGGIWASWLRMDTAETGRVEVDVSGLASSFSGPMGDLLASVEAGEEPTLSFRRNLATLETVYAEQASAEAGGAWQSLT